LHISWALARLHPLTPLPLRCLSFARSLGSFFQNVVWIQFSTIVAQTVAFYAVSKDDVNFLVVLGGCFYVPCSFAVTPLIEKFGVVSSPSQSTAPCVV